MGTSENQRNDPTCRKQPDCYSHESKCYYKLSRIFLKKIWSESDSEASEKEFSIYLHLPKTTADNMFIYFRIN